jgi:AraC family transcriptional regulator
MQTNNKYGYAAGDIVIAEAFARIERELSDNMLLFRTGGDEFAVVTAYKTVSDAEALARKITAQNGAAVKAGEHEIPLSLHVGISQIPEKALSYQKALAILGSAVNEARKSPDRVAVYVEESDK